MKRLLLITSFALLISGCGGSKTLTYSVQFDTTDISRRNDLSLSARKVVERRLERLNGTLNNFDLTFDEKTDATTIMLEVGNTKAADALNEEMTAPFNFELRSLASEHQDGDIDVENVGSFRATGITGTDVDWVEGQTIEPPLSRGRILIGFTEAGRQKIQTLFQEQKGNTIGIFVRERLAASVGAVEGSEVQNVLVIDGVPSGDLAKVFADDMNTGIHMTFSPIK